MTAVGSSIPLHTCSRVFSVPVARRIDFTARCAWRCSIAVQCLYCTLYNAMAMLVLDFNYASLRLLLLYSGCSCRLACSHSKFLPYPSGESLHHITPRAARAVRCPTRLRRRGIAKDASCACIECTRSARVRIGMATG